MSDTPDQGPDVDLDQALAAIDPEFSKSMVELGGIKNADVDLEVDHLDLEVDEDAPGEGAGARGPHQRALAAVGRVVFGLRRAVEFARHLARLFARAGRLQKFGVVLMFATAGLALVILRANLRGAWIPPLGTPVVGQFTPSADEIMPIGAEEPWVRLDLAFPPETHEFLFKRFKVNLRATTENPHPMGAFEFVVAVDGDETATEARDREVELADDLQRTFEAQTFADLETEIGKANLKTALKDVLEAKLGPNRVRAVNFKTFVLKP